MDSKQITAIKTNIFTIPGMQVFPGSVVVFGENHVRDTTNAHLTFMSDGCVTDADNGETFMAFMRDKGCVVDRRTSRTMSVKMDDLARLFA
jgi:hypothetical protein